MNTLKPLLIIAIVGGIGYGAWSRLNRKPDSAQGWDSTPTVQLGDPGTNWAPGGAPGAAGGPPGSPPTFSGLAPTPANAPPGAPPLAMTDSANPAATPPTAQPLDGAPSFAAQPPATDPASASVYGAAPASAAPSAYPQTTAAPADATSAAPAGEFSLVLERARHELDAGRLAEGLLQMSAWHDSPQLSPGEQQQLNGLLDQVAGTVIYSTRAFGEPLYEVQPGERLDDIAARYSVSPQLLAKINGLEDPQNLRPGERLKVLHGPFEASISLDKRILTLWIGGSYAGRFAVGIGRDYPPPEGQYAVENKSINPAYHGPDRQIEGGDPSNPLGTRWVGLAGGYGIHGTNDPNSLGAPEQLGCIALSQRDVEDLFDILTVGSRVTIHR